MDGLTVHLVRHGQSFNTHRPADEPYPPNPTLTPTGLAEARRLAERLAGLRIDRLVSSPMRRAVETALVVSEAIGRPVEVWPHCYEYRPQPGYMSWGARELRARYPSLCLPEDLGEDDWYFGEEGLDRALARADTLLAFLREAASRMEIDQLVVVTHGAITRVALSRLLFADYQSLEPLLEFNNTAITTLRVTDDTIKILAVNDTSHLVGLPELDPLHGVSR